ncbi:MAG TPA: glycosyltransferase family 87 protein [Acidimicrobiales bacterium]|nr:glycosyltransferase family 87 protein [Acidimicrobiales bacterium]
MSDSVHRGDRSPPEGPFWQGVRAIARRGIGQVSGLTPEGRDALLYGGSALFAGATGLLVRIPLYRQWGQLAVGPYAAAAVIMALVAAGAGRPAATRSPPTRRPRTVRRTARVVAFLIVLFGATVVPLTLEVVWRSQGNPALHVQPEVVVVEQAGARAADGHDPYRVIDRNGHVVIAHQASEPAYELYYPYLPGMVIFGVASDANGEARLTDARIQFLVFTAVVGLVALSRLRPRTDARVRALQVLTVLPTAALPLATGGDDLPVVALMLAGLVALQRRRPVLAGLALGAASSLKFTAWPLVVLALFAARDRSRRGAVGRYVLGVVAVCGPVVLPLALRNPAAFVDNVVRYPLGLAGVSSPAASALPGHILVALAPGAHRAYVVVVGLVGAVVLLWYLRRRPPSNAGEVASLTGWVMTIAILLAPATRVGYLLYPVNLFVWAWMLRRSADPAVPAEAPDRCSSATGRPSPAAPGVQLASGSSNSSMENGVTPADVVSDTTAPTSQ